MTPATEVQALFRRQYGSAADPEDRPAEWAEILAQTVIVEPEESLPISVMRATVIAATGEAKASVGVLIGRRVIRWDTWPPQAERCVLCHGHNDRFALRRWREKMTATVKRIVDRVLAAARRWRTGRGFGTLP